ncbi:hypothetical protein SLA2020_164060 [Shorea laevis]
MQEWDLNGVCRRVYSKHRGPAMARTVVFASTEEVALGVRFLRRKAGDPSFLDSLTPKSEPNPGICFC